MKILILGGDGYIGWPLALYLKKQGHDVLAVDCLVRRNSPSLVPIASYVDRAKIIPFKFGDVTDYAFISGTIEKFKPEAVVHLAEQRSAPYSMIDREHALYTMRNNVEGTLNVAYAMKELCPNAHLVKLGTMGEYGTPNVDIPEGFFDYTDAGGRTDRLPFPKQAGSFYHLSKVHDSNNLMFISKIWGLKVTDLNQGVVYGIDTDDTVDNPSLSTRLDYDEIYGTVLNRFCVQAATNIPLTVYGGGNQKRGFINLTDSLRCIELAILNPPTDEPFRVFNQFTEEFTINELATLVQDTGKDIGLTVSASSQVNPRVENENNYYNATHTALVKLGLEPHALNGEVVQSVIGKAQAFSDRINTNLINPTVDWKKPTN